MLHPWSLSSVATGVQVREARPEEGQLWAETIGKGFFELDQLTREECDVGLAQFHMPESRCFFAEAHGETMGGGGMAIRDNVATLFGASTLPRARRRGVQIALIQARLTAAQQAGCTLASATTQPGSQSQRNYERLGFQVAYTKVIMKKEL